MKQNIIEEAIQAPANERVQLAEMLLESIEYGNSKIDSLWIDEVKNRMQSVEKGTTKLIDFVFT
jgi:DNA-binding sugar fermentation-stimulating protein